MSRVKFSVYCAESPREEHLKALLSALKERMRGRPWFGHMLCVSGSKTSEFVRATSQYSLNFSVVDDSDDVCFVVGRMHKSLVRQYLEVVFLCQK